MNQSIASESGPLQTVHRLPEAINNHDLDALVACFSADYVNETPAHPHRGFTGQEQVRTNWARMFATIPDLNGELLATVVDGDRVWSEWRMTGTRPDGSAHEMAGVMIFTVRDAEISAVRFFLEPVERLSGTVDDAVRRQLAGVEQP
ncbi:nuclear transport factor 2 family protein [Pseudarthrobacter sp. N5]|uniref:nuclear transport factor 2 family protein n=1 Tax=Pseudarthrobacter sp. N5 TaxID=3418416 RepID=UPI003CF16F53